jgi:uncharacterized protein (TIGR00255 family)
MPIASMTGFARATGGQHGLTWVWELRSVNGKGLDTRLRLPPGFEHLEAPARTSLTEAFKRGNIQASLTVSGHEAEPQVRLNTVVLDQLVRAAEELRKRLNGPPVQPEALLSLRGVIEIEDKPLDEDASDARDTGIIQSLSEAVAALSTMRAGEGQRLQDIITAQMARMEALTVAVRDNPGRKPEAIRARLKELVAKLEANGLDPDRLHQEAVILAAKADVQEELDRLFAHIAAVRDLVKAGGAVGRKLDFLAQEFNREANTLCSKANEKALIAIGLDLKTVIDQLREQIQNIE